MRPFLCAICFAAVLCASAGRAADVYCVPAIQKITPRQAPDASWSDRGIALQCARNEWDAFQVVIRSQDALAGVRIRLTDLRGPHGAVLPTKLARLYKVEWVDIAAPYEVDKPSLHPDLRPDPLVPIKADDAFALEPGSGSSDCTLTSIAARACPHYCMRRHDGLQPLARRCDQVEVREKCRRQADR